MSVGALYRLFLDPDPEPVGRDHWLARFGDELDDLDLAVFRGAAALERPSGSSVWVRFGGQGKDTLAGGGGIDRFDYNGALTLTGGFNAVAGATLAAALDTDPAAEVFIVTSNIADNGFNVQGLYCAAMFPSSARTLLGDYAAFEAQLLASGGALGAAVAGLDAAVAASEQVLFVLDDGMASVVLRYAAQAGLADRVLSGELDLVGLFTNMAQMGAADFV